MNEQTYTLSGTSPYAVGNCVEGFNFSMGTDLRGKIVEVRPVLTFAYVLESGDILGPWDDIYRQCKEEGVSPSLS